MLVLETSAQWPVTVENMQTALPDGMAFTASAATQGALLLGLHDFKDVITGAVEPCFALIVQTNEDLDARHARMADRMQMFERKPIVLVLREGMTLNAQELAQMIIVIGDHPVCT